MGGGETGGGGGFLVGLGWDGLLSSFFPFLHIIAPGAGGEGGHGC